MLDPAAGPFLFDTSAEGWLARNTSPDVVRWLYAYLGRHQFSVSAVTVTERIRGYSMLWRRSGEGARGRIEVARVAYLSQLGNVLPVDSAVAVVAGGNGWRNRGRNGWLAGGSTDLSQRRRWWPGYRWCITTPATSRRYEAPSSSLRSDSPDLARWNSSDARCWHEFQCCVKHANTFQQSDTTGS